MNERERAVLTDMPPQIKLDVPLMFSAMSFGSISLNAQKALAMAARELGTYFNTGEGGLHRDLEAYADHAIVQVASGRFGVDPHYLNAGAAVEIKIGQGAKPGIGGHLPGEKIDGEVSRTRMIPQGTDAISPAPHHDIYSIEDLRQLVFSLKEATRYAKPGGGQDSRRAQRGGHCERHGARRGGHRRARRLPRGTGAAPSESGQRGHSRGACARGGGPAPARRGHTFHGQPRGGGLHPLVGGRGAGHRPGGGRRVLRIGPARRAWVPPVPGLLERQVQLGHRHAAPELTKRLNPEIAAERVVNLVRGWNHEIQEMMGGMGINAVDSLRGNRLMLRGVGLNEKELEILGVKYAGE